MYCADVWKMLCICEHHPCFSVGHPWYTAHLFVTTPNLWDDLHFPSHLCLQWKMERYYCWFLEESLIFYIKLLYLIIKFLGKYKIMHHSYFLSSDLFICLWVVWTWHLWWKHIKLKQDFYFLLLWRMYNYFIFYFWNTSLLGDILHLFK